MKHISSFEGFMNASSILEKNNKPKRITKNEIKLAMYKPRGDYFMEPIDAYSIRLHLTAGDAFDSVSSLSNKFDVEEGIILFFTGASVFILIFFIKLSFITAGLLFCFVLLLLLFICS